MKKILIAILLSLGCTGGLNVEVDESATQFAPDPNDPSANDPSTQNPNDDPSLGEPNVGSTSIARIRREEYLNYVTQTFGNVEVRVASLPVDHRVGQFASNSGESVTQGDLDLYWQSGEFVASQLSVADYCDVGDEDTICFEAVVRQIGSSLFRRPVDEASKDAYATFVFDTISEGADRQETFEVLVAALLQSPDFIYHVEPATDVPEPQTVDGYVVANRLASFIWRSVPDDELLRAADANALRTREQLEAQARRMLADPRAVETITRFHRDWLEVSRIDDVSVDAATFPEFDGARDDLSREYDLFVEEVVRENGFSDLFAADWSILNDTLGSYYGVAGVGGGFSAVENIPNRRGIMTTGAVLSVHGDGGFTQALFRGLFVREEVLCHGLPSRPASVEEGLTEQEATLPADSSDRERLDHLTNKNDCAFCHVMMNPIGYGFEGYDAIGRWRDVDTAGQEIVLPFSLEGNGNDVYATDIDADYGSAIDLAQALGTSDTARTCYAKQWFRYGLGRWETPEDAAIAAMVTTLQATDDIEEMLITLATSDAFLLRSVK